MRLTSLDIKRQEFDAEFRGFNKQAVESFLNTVATQWEEMQEERRQLENTVRDLRARMEHYQKVEEALQEALQTAKINAKKTQENAEEKAKNVLREAELRAQQITKEAEQERYNLKRELARLTNRRGEITARLRAFLLSEMEMLASYEGDDPVGFIKLLPSEQADRKSGRLKAASPKLESPEEGYEPYDDIEHIEKEEPSKEGLEALGGAGKEDWDESMTFADEDDVALQDQFSSFQDQDDTFDSFPTFDADADDDLQFEQSAPVGGEDFDVTEEPQPFGKAPGNQKKYTWSPDQELGGRTRRTQNSESPSSPLDEAEGWLGSYEDSDISDEDLGMIQPQQNASRPQGSGYAMRPIVSAPGEAPPATSPKGTRPAVAGSREEIDRIRRILDDLD